MAAFTKSNAYAYDRDRGKHDWSTHVFKYALVNAAASATPAVLADLTQISTGNGWSGPRTLSVTLSQVGGGTKIVIADDTWSASGGSVGPFRTAYIYNDSVAGKPIVGGYDYGSSQTLADGEPFLFDFDGSLGFATGT